LTEALWGNTEQDLRRAGNGDVREIDSTLGGVTHFSAVRMIDPQHDQTRVHVVWHILAGLRQRVHAREIASHTQTAIC
jgi:hypothetical protein